MFRKAVLSMLLVGLLYSFAFAPGKPPEKLKFPDELKGFKGTIGGAVISKQDNGFTIKIMKVGNILPGNKAANPESAVGKIVLISAGGEKGKDGKWRPIEAQIKFISSLKFGEIIKIQVVNDEGERLHIIELDQWQRERAEKSKPETEKEKPKSSEGEIRRDGQLPDGEPAKEKDAKVEPIKTELRTSDTKYIEREGKEGAENGRIVAKLRNIAACEIEVYNTKGDLVKSISIKESREAFEVEGLEPGAYIVCIDIPGFKTVEKKLEVKAKNDALFEVEIYSKLPPVKKPEPRVLPADFRGFSGSLIGIVVGKEEKGFILKVFKVANVWKDNKAVNPESANGKEVLITGGWEKIKEGRSIPSESHLKFINALKIKEEIRIEVKHKEGEQLNILELTKEQRERAEKYKPEPEKEKAKSSEGEIRRE